MVKVDTNVGQAYPLALDLEESMSVLSVGRLGVEVEDVDTRHRGSEVPSGRVEAAPLVVEDLVKLQVDRGMECLVP